MFYTGLFGILNEIQLKESDIVNTLAKKVIELSLPVILLSFPAVTWSMASLGFYNMTI